MSAIRFRSATRQSRERRAAGNKRLIRVLLVEDDDDVRFLLAFALRNHGYDVTAVATADRALEAMRGRRHDLVLTDYCLPRKDGLQFLAEAQSAGVLAKAPVIVCTAVPPTTATAAATSTSDVTVLEKPVDLDALLQQIRAILRR